LAREHVPGRLALGETNIAGPPTQGVVMITAHMARALAMIPPPGGKKGQYRSWNT